MAMYQCEHCDRLVDDDYYPGEDCADCGIEGYSLICPVCVEILEEEDE